MFKLVLHFAILTLAAPLLVEYSSLLQKTLRGLFPGPNDPVVKSMGKILIVGGSPENPADPYLSAITALKVGAEQANVITTKDNAETIRTYGTDVQARGLLDQNNTEIEIIDAVRKCDVVLWGPGVRKDNYTVKALVKVLQVAKDNAKPVIIDQGGVDILIEMPELLASNKYHSAVIITDDKQYELLKYIHGVNKTTKEISFNKLGNFVTIVKTGIIDSCISANRTLVWRIVGGHSPKNLEGKGRFLSGTLATLYNWALQKHGNRESVLFSGYVASYGAARFARDYSRRAFEEKHWGVVTSDMINQISRAIGAHLLF